MLPHLLADFRKHNLGSGIIDLKAYYRGFQYVREMLRGCLKSFRQVILITQVVLTLDGSSQDK
ncbi:MAG: hypothetical protein KAF91_28885 [Nostoc sp. TH1S01]|nr:hypothetical protein [Nostoc sp. TH1S01]